MSCTRLEWNEDNNIMTGLASNKKIILSPLLFPVYSVGLRDFLQFILFLPFRFPDIFFSFPKGELRARESK